MTALRDPHLDGELSGLLAPGMRSGHSVQPDVARGIRPGHTLVMALGGLGGLPVVVAAGRVIAV